MKRWLLICLVGLFAQRIYAEEVVEEIADNDPVTTYDTNGNLPIGTTGGWRGNSIDPSLSCGQQGVLNQANFQQQQRQYILPTVLPGGHTNAPQTINL